MDINISGINISDMVTGSGDAPAAETKSKRKSSKADPEKQKVAKTVTDYSRAVKEGKKAQQEEDTDQKHELIVQIHRYLADDRFGPYLRELGFAQTTATLQKKTVDALKDELAKIKIAIGSKNGGQFVRSAVLGGIKTLEPISQHVYNVVGLSDALSNDDNFLDTLREVELENQNVAYVNPKIRLAGIVAAKAMAVNRVHSLFKNKKPDEQVKLAKSMLAKSKALPAPEPAPEPVVQDSAIDFTKLPEEHAPPAPREDNLEVVETPVVEQQPDEQQPINIKETNESKAKKVAKKPAKAPAKAKKAAVKSEPAAKKPRAKKGKAVSFADSADANDPESADGSSEATTNSAPADGICITRYTAEQLSSLAPESRALNEEFMSAAGNIQLPDTFL